MIGSIIMPEDWWPTGRPLGSPPMGKIGGPSPVPISPAAPVANAPDSGGSIMEGLELWHWAAIAAVVYFMFIRK